MKATRLKQMEQYIQEQGSVTIEELCTYFGIHPNTARSDVQTLAEHGLVEKKYGKVIAAAQATTDYGERKQKNMDAKAQIGILAAPLLEENDIVYMDAGTTVPHILTCGAPLPKRLTIITNSVEIVHWVTVNTDYTIFVLPGQIDRRLNSILSVETTESVKAYKFNKAIIGIRGISDKGELLSSSGLDARMKNIVLSMCDNVILMADSNKAGANNGIYSFSSLEKVKTWVCERSTSEIVNFCHEFNVTLITNEA